MSRDGADRFLPLAIEIVKQAIALDGEGKFKEAYYKYKEALERFMTVRDLSTCETRANTEARQCSARACSCRMHKPRSLMLS